MDVTPTVCVEPFLYILVHRMVHIWWEVIRPLPPQRVRFPLVVDSLFQEQEPLDHIELLYIREQRYDAIHGLCQDWKGIQLTTPANWQAER